MRGTRIDLAALALLLCTAFGCDWVEKTVECRKLTRLSAQWGEQGDRFGSQLETRLDAKLAVLDDFDPSSRRDLVRASRELREASDTLDAEVDGFFDEFSSAFGGLPLRDAKLARLRDRYLAHVDDVSGRVHELTGSVRHLGNVFANLYPELITTERAARELEARMTDAEQRITLAERRLEESGATEERILGQIDAYCMLPVPPQQG